MVAAKTASTRWLVRIIPLILAGCAGLATYVVVKRVCCMFVLLNFNVTESLCWPVANVVD